MKRKHIFQVAALFLVLSLSIPAASTGVSPARNASEMTEDPRAGKLIQRLEEIRDMDRGEMTRLERKALRREVKEIKKEMKQIKGGVYLSVGAIIIIILLLILIL